MSLDLISLMEILSISRGNPSSCSPSLGCSKLALMIGIGLAILNLIQSPVVPQWTSSGAWTPEFQSHSAKTPTAQQQRQEDENKKPNTPLEPNYGSNNTTPDLTEVGINHGSNTNHGENSKAGTRKPKKRDKNLAPIQLSLIHI